VEGKPSATGWVCEKCCIDCKPTSVCESVKCGPDERSDGKQVIFEEVK